MQAYPEPMSDLLEEKKERGLSYLQSDYLDLCNKGVGRGFAEPCSEIRKVITYWKAAIVKGKNCIFIRNMYFRVKFFPLGSFRRIS